MPPRKRDSSYSLSVGWTKANEACERTQLVAGNIERFEVIEAQKRLFVELLNDIISEQKLSEAIAKRRERRLAKNAHQRALDAQNRRSNLQNQNLP